MKTIITGNNSKVLPNFIELYRYRQLLYSLALRDIKVKYSQTFIGLLWSVINPLFTMLVLVFAFNKIGNVSTGNINPLVFTLSGLVTWNYFAALFSEASNSLILNQELIKKIYFPRLVIPLSKALSGMIELLVTLTILFILIAYFESNLSENIIFAPFFLLIALLCGWTGGIWISALSIRYRDFVFTIPFLTRMGILLSPIAYSSSLVDEKYKLLYYLNPITGSIEGFRWALFGNINFPSYFWISFVILIIFFVSGIIYFIKVEREMADIL